VITHMELRTYVHIIRRWWWLILLPRIIIGGIGLATYQRPPTTYGSTVRFTASLPPTVSGEGFDPNYYSWLTSEYIVGSLSDWIKTGAFAEAVSEELTTRGHPLPAPAVQGALASDYVRSQLLLYVNTGNPDDTKAIAEAAIMVLQTRNADAFPQLGGENAVVNALDVPSVGAITPGLRSMLDLPIRLGLGLAVGLALAFAAHYLDPRIRSRDDVQLLGLKVIGEIPKK
jgi:capsular polysaccharide biosynthesis protein